MTTDTPTVAVVYESMFGSTRHVAEAIAEGLREHHPLVVSVADARDLPAEIDTVIVGAPTHVHGLSRPSTRTEAANWAREGRFGLILDADAADHEGVREWLASGSVHPQRHAAFDTRADIPRIFGGSAAAVIDRRLRRLGSRPFATEQSFVVDRTSALIEGELERARAWGAELGAALAAESAGSRAGA